MRTEISTLMERRGGVLQPTEKAKRLLRVKREAMSKHGTLISEKQAEPMRALLGDERARAPEMRACCALMRDERVPERAG